MFSTRYKNKIKQKYKLSETIINRPNNYRIPYLLDSKMKNNNNYASTKYLNNKNSFERNIFYKMNTFVPENKYIPHQTKKIYIKRIEYLLNKEISNIHLDKKIDKNIKMIYEVNNLPHIENKTIIKNIYNKKNIKLSSKILPNVYSKLQKSQNFNKLLSLNFFTPELIKIKKKKGNKNINLIDLKLKNIKVNNIDKKKQMLISDKSMDCNMCTIKIAKNDKKKELKDLIISKNKDIEDECNNTNYSFYNSPIPSIRSKYFVTHNINDNSNNDYEN